MGDVIFEIESHLKLNKNLEDGDAIISIIKCRNIQANKVPYSDDIPIDVICEHRWNMGFRKKLADVISKNFRCSYRIISGSVFMSGMPTDAKIAKLVFEYAYGYALMAGNRLYNKAYSLGKQTKGVFNDYVDNFIDNLVHNLEEKI